MLNLLADRSARPRSCCWLTTARSTRINGAARRTTRSCGSIRWVRKAPTRCFARCSATMRELGALKRLIIEKTEGNPFFMEERVQVLLDEGALVRKGAVKLTQAVGRAENSVHGASDSGRANRQAAG